MRLVGNMLKHDHVPMWLHACISLKENIKNSLILRPYSAFRSCLSLNEVPSLLLKWINNFHACRPDCRLTPSSIVSETEALNLSSKTNPIIFYLSHSNECQNTDDWVKLKTGKIHFRTCESHFWQEKDINVLATIEY